MILLLLILLKLCYSVDLAVLLSLLNRQIAEIPCQSIVDNILALEQIQWDRCELEMSTSRCEPYTIVFRNIQKGPH